MMSLQEIWMCKVSWCHIFALLIFRRGLVNKRAQSVSSGQRGELQSHTFESSISKPRRQLRPQLCHIHCKSDSSWHLRKVKDSGKQNLQPPYTQALSSQSIGAGRWSCSFSLSLQGLESLWKTSGPLWRRCTSIKSHGDRKKSKQT